MVLHCFAITESYAVTLKATMMKIKLLLVDDNEIFRKGLARLLQEESNLEVVDTCPCGPEAVESACRHQPDVVLTDIASSECSKTDIVQCIHQRLPKTAVIVLTQSKTNEDIISAATAGARGYISKNITPEKLVNTITRAAEGDLIISPPMSVNTLAILGSLGQQEFADELRAVAALSKREKQVLSLVAQGFTNRQIATTLVISEHTVKVHLQNVMQKLNAHTRQQAVALARRNGFIEGALRSLSD